MPPGILHFDGGGALFPAMDMNLPEGFLLAQLRERSPKTPPTKMQLLSLTEAQTTDIKKIRALAPSGVNRPTPAEQSRTESEIMALLTDEQKATWTKQKGQPFEFPTSTFHPARGFRGSPWRPL